jgi:biopolymer transport protein ExbD
MPNRCKKPLFVFHVPSRNAVAKQKFCDDPLHQHSTKLHLQDKQGRKMNLRPRPELSTGAMSVFAFLLLIFFVTTTQILDEQGIQVVLPRMDSIPVPAHNTDLYHIHINSANKILADGRLIELSELGQTLHAYITEPGLMHPRRTVISLHCDRETSYQVFVDVHDAIRSTYRIIWNDMALERYDRAFPSLNGHEKKAISDQLPLVISEADWNRH